MCERIELFAERVRAAYGEVIVGSASRIVRGRALFDQFEAAVVICSQDSAHGRLLTERVNELAAAKLLAEDQHLTGAIEYEPDLLPDGRKIDFVAARGDENVYVEVKTVHPDTDDTAEAWNNYVRRRQHHPENVHFTVEREWMGGALYGNVFSSRSHFLEYTLDFEARLAAAKAIRSGPGILVFCGNGFAWRLSDLEDFADFYHAGAHREDDPFALMEQHHMETHGLQILRNVDYFGCLRRHAEQADLERFTLPVRGPAFGAPPRR
jgi:hypothetical protein